MRVLFSGGGTGGHIYPGLAIMREIEKRERDATFLYVGSATGLEASIVKKTGLPFQEIHISGFKRKLALDNFKTLYQFITAVRESKKIIKTFNPDLVIGTGGYVCGPVIFAASALGIPTLIHEQNVVPGLTNKFLSRYASAVALSFPESEQYFKKPRVQVTGNPRATEVYAASSVAGRESLGIPAHKKIILTVGGSRGASAINLAFLGMIKYLSALPDCHFVYVTGEVHYQEMKDKIEAQHEFLGQVSIKPFIYNMPDVLAATSLIINRAGASFLAEITALGLPSILIPSPYVTNNHQEKNARMLEKNGAAKVILEKDLDSSVLFQMIKEIVDDHNVLEEMGKASQNLGYPEAAQHIYKLVKEVLQQK